MVGVLRFDLLIHDCHSLKSKRGCVRKIIARIKNKFDVSAAEVGALDLWQRAEIAVAVVGNDRAVINQKLDHILNFVDRLGAAEVRDHKMEMINL